MRFPVVPSIIVLCGALLFVRGPGLQARDQEARDLASRARAQFSPLPAAMAAEAHRLTTEKIRLGKILFYEPRISIDGTVSCARCHPFGLYAADGLKTSVGNRCVTNTRNAPTVLNAAGQVSQHWIGNRTDVEDQARQSVTGAGSFGMPSPAAVEDVLKGIAGYRAIFEAAFSGESEPVTVAHLAEAIGAFERTLVTPSPFDAYLSGDESALNPEEKKGLAVFLDTGCASCHSGTYVGGGMYRKFGITGPYWEYTKTEKIDEGRFAVTKNKEDRYAFKVPGLRNVARTQPYFHDGSVDSLETAVGIMSEAQLGRDLPPGERAAIVAFLSSLTGRIPEDALRVPELPSGVRGPAGPSR